MQFVRSAHVQCMHVYIVCDYVSDNRKWQTPFSQEVHGVGLCPQAMLSAGMVEAAKLTQNARQQNLRGHVAL